MSSTDRNIIKEDIDHIKSDLPWTKNKIIESVIERRKNSLIHNIIKRDKINQLEIQDDSILQLINLQTLVTHLYNHYKICSSEYGIKYLGLDEFGKTIIQQREKRQEFITKFQNQGGQIAVTIDKNSFEEQVILKQLLIYPNNPNPGLIWFEDSEGKGHDIINTTDREYVIASL